MNLIFRRLVRKKNTKTLKSLKSLKTLRNKHSSRNRSPSCHPSVGKRLSLPHDVQILPATSTIQIPRPLRPRVRQGMGVRTLGGAVQCQRDNLVVDRIIPDVVEVAVIAAGPDPRSSERPLSWEPMITSTEVIDSRELLVNSGTSQTCLEG